MLLVQVNVCTLVWPSFANMPNSSFRAYLLSEDIDPLEEPATLAAYLSPSGHPL